MLILEADLEDISALALEEADHGFFIAGYKELCRNGHGAVRGQTGVPDWLFLSDEDIFQYQTEKHNPALLIEHSTAQDPVSFFGVWVMIQVQLNLHANEWTSELPVRLFAAHVCHDCARQNGGLTRKIEDF